MPAVVDLFPMEALLRALLSSDVQSRLEIFQILDTLLYYLRDRGVMPTVHAFALPPNVADTALFIEGYLKSRQPEILSQELVSLSSLRPYQARLPILPPFDTRYGGDFTVRQLSHWHDQAGNQKYNLVRNYDHAVLLDIELHGMNNKLGKTAGVLDCQDFPATDEERRVLVDRLVEAMVNYDGVIEKPVIDRSRRRTKQSAGLETGQDEDGSATKDNYRVKRVKNTPNVELQIIAWKILYFIKDAQDGNIYLPDRNGKQVEYTKYPSFMARYEKVGEALKTSKALVGDMMAWDHGRRLVAAPEKEQTRKKANKDGNEKKGDLLKVGIAVTKAKKSQVPENSPMTIDSPAAPAGSQL